MGADDVIDYTTQDARVTDAPYDWIVDVDAHHSILSWRNALKPNGVYVALGGGAGWFAKTLVQQPACRLRAVDPWA